MASAGSPPELLSSQVVELPQGASCSAPLTSPHPLPADLPCSSALLLLFQALQTLPWPYRPLPRLLSKWFDSGIPPRTETPLFHRNPALLLPPPTLGVEGRQMERGVCTAWGAWCGDKQVGRTPGWTDGQGFQLSPFLNGHGRNEVAAPGFAQDAESVNENSL